MPDTPPTTTTTTTKYTSDDARALYLEQLKKTDPSPAVRKVIQDLETPRPRRKRRRRHSQSTQAIA